MTDALADSPTSDARPLTTRAVAGTAALMVARRLVLVALSGVSIVVVARALHPADYGQLQAALATWTLVLAFCDFGFSMSLGRDFAAQPEHARSLLGTAYRVQTVWSVVPTAVLLGIAAADGFGNERAHCLAVLAPSVLTSGVLAGRVLYQARLDVVETVRIDIVVNVVQVGAMVGVALAGGGAVGVAAAISCGTAVNAVWIGMVAHRSVGHLDPSPRDARGLLKRALPLGAMGVLSKVYLSIDLVIVGFYTVGDSLGDYASAVKLVTLVNTIPGLLMASALPAFASHQDDPVARKELLGRMAHWGAAAVLPLFLALLVFPDVAVDLALGHEYEGARPLVQILAVSGIVSVVSALVGTVLVAAHVVRPLFWQNLVAVIGNVGLNVALIPHFGVTACAWITLGTEVFVCGGGLLAMWRHLGLVVPLRSSRAALAVVALASLAGAVFPSDHTYLRVGVAAVVLVAGLGGLRAWPEELRPRRRAAHPSSA